MKPAFAAAALATLLLSGCASAPGAPLALAGTHWKLASASAGPLAPLASESGVTLDIGADSIEGHGGCNRYRASYVLDHGKLVAGAVGATKRGCGDDAGRVEAAWFAILAAPLEATIEGNELALRAQDGTALRFMPAGAANPP